jgi:DNA polymerase-3 subunit epsilon
MNPPTPFPVNRLAEVEQHPENFLLIERVPITLTGAVFPIAFNEHVGDERPFVVVDTETTGLDAGADKMIELGLVRGYYSPSASRITSISGAISLLEDPGIPIPEEITRITGITDADVAGKRIDEDEVSRWFEGDPLILAHNAKFDRPFVDARLPALVNGGWACTAFGIDWKALGYEGAKLEYLLYKHGYFYDGHRAEVDCLATAWLLHTNPAAFAAALDSARERTVVVRAFGAPFDVKDALKDRGYRWHPGDTGSNKCWWTSVSEKDLDAEQAFLEGTYHNGSGSAHYEKQTARSRFKGDVR